MKTRNLTYLLFFIITLGGMFTSCDGYEGADTKAVEGYWIYSGTKADVFAVDSAVQRKVEEYVKNRNSELKISYEFNNDRTYYYYKSLEAPSKGIFKSLDEEYFLMDGPEGMKTLSSNDSVLYIMSDIKEEIVRELDVDSRILVKAFAIDTFSRGLSVE